MQNSQPPEIQDPNKNGNPRPSTSGVYEKPGTPAIYDALITAMFAPFGGVRHIRQTAVDALAAVPGTPVVELGCGTGGLTRGLVARGLVVTAIDGSPNMLQRARQRVPGARFELQELSQLSLPPEHYHGAFAAFVFHELPTSVRREVLRRVLAALKPPGAIVIVDHAVPVAGLVARPWRHFLLRLEPPSVRETIEAGYAAELLEAGFVSVVEHGLAGGTARMWLAQRPGRPSQEKS